MVYVEINDVVGVTYKIDMLFISLIYFLALIYQNEKLNGVEYFVSFTYNVKFLRLWLYQQQLVPHIGDAAEPLYVTTPLK